MRKLIFVFAIIVLILTANSFGQPKRKKNLYSLPEKDDEVLVTFRKKTTKPKVSSRKKSTKRKKSILQFDEADAIFGKRHKRGVTHDPEFENWANRKRKITKPRRKNK